MVRPGIVDLRDLVRRYHWEPRALPRFIDAAGLIVDNAPPARAFAPPRVLLAIVPIGEAPVAASLKPWLAEAERIVFVRDATVDVRSDPAVTDLVEEDWRALVAGLPVVGVYDWLADPAPCREAIDRAVAAAAELAERAPAVAAPYEPIELPLGSWIAFECDPSHARTRCCAAQLAIRDGRAVLVTDRAGQTVDLAAPPPRVAIADAGDGALPPGRSSLLSPLRAHLALAFDPHHPVGWRGHRMAFYWSYVGRDAVGHLSCGDHDFPCGPAKKCRGYNNHPVQVTLAPSADAYLARFDHDVLVGSAVPIPWQRAGRVDLARFEPDPRRALLYAQHEAPEDADELNEDARDFAPAVVLGPSDAARYAVDLSNRVLRITRPTIGTRDGMAVLVNRPDAQIGIFDADHRLVRAASGRLLGGWWRWATIEQDGSYWREDLGTGERTHIGRVDDRVCTDPDDEAIARDAFREGRDDVAAAIHERYPHARVPLGRAQVLAIPGTRNILIVTDGYFRVV